MEFPAHYQKTQPGTPVVTIAGAASLVQIVTIARGTEAIAIPLAALFVCLLIGTIFSSLTIAIGSTEIAWWLAFRLFPQRVALTDIEQVAPFRLPWYTSYGIRFGAKLVAWIVSGFGAIEIVRRDGRRVILRTSDPAGAVAALQRAIEAR